MLSGDRGEREERMRWKREGKVDITPVEPRYILHICITSIKYSVRHRESITERWLFWWQSLVSVLFCTLSSSLFPSNTFHDHQLQFHLKPSGIFFFPHLGSSSKQMNRKLNLLRKYPTDIRYSSSFIFLNRISHSLIYKWREMTHKYLFFNVSA